MIKVLVVRVGEEPLVEEVTNPFNFARLSLLKGDFVEHLTLPDGVVVYYDEASVRRLLFNRAIPAMALHHKADFIVDTTKGDRAKPGELGEHRIRGNFLLTRHEDGSCVDLSQDEIITYTTMLQLSKIGERCKRCGSGLAYRGALFCGAACSARFEAGE